MSGHTEGPWFAEEYDFGWRIGTEPGDGDIVDYVEAGFREAEANAHLIAAAPDLLEALEGMVAWTNHRWPGADISKSSLATPLAKARAAIARAKGDAS